MLVLFKPVTMFELFMRAKYDTTVLASNAALILLVTEEEMVTAFRAGQSLKAEVPIVVRVFPEKVTDAKLAQNENALS